MRQDTSEQDTEGDVGPDAVDVIVGEWRRQRPDLDPAAKEITGRIIRLASLFQQAYGDTFTPLGLNEGDYGILAPLRRAGAPYTLTPTELAKHRMISSGGMTAALDRLERKGLLERLPNPADRRGSLVRLTENGLEVINRAMSEHVLTEARLVAGLKPAEQDALRLLLRKLLRSLEP